MKIPTIEVEVELDLSDGTSQTGVVFILANQRVLDLLNDPRAFFPFRRRDGQVIMLNKRQVVAVRPLDQRG